MVDAQLHLLLNLWKRSQKTTYLSIQELNGTLVSASVKSNDSL